MARTTRGCRSRRRKTRDALQATGIDSVMKVYADEGHGLAKRANRLDALPEAVEFLVERLRRVG